jgi:hypothetical protein
MVLRFAASGQWHMLHCVPAMVVQRPVDGLDSKLSSGIAVAVPAQFGYVGTRSLNVR